MMKRFSTRADKWLYVFALISHIFNFLAESQILFLYHIDDHQEDHLFLLILSFKSIFKSFFFLLVHLYHFSSLLFFQFIFIIFFFSSSCSVSLFFFFQFFSSFSFSFSFRRSSKSRLSSFLVIWFCSIFRKSEKFSSFSFSSFFSFFSSFSSECFASLN